MKRSLRQLGHLHRHSSFVVSILAALLCLPFLRTVWGLGDEGIWLHAADRMIHGQILYRDFFEFHPPGGFLLTSAWLSVFGSSLFAARSLAVLVIAITAGFTYSCCRALSGRARLSMLLTLSWVAASQGGWTQINHHWFTSMFSMIAMWSLMPADGKSRQPILAGLAASAATLVTTHRGAIIVLAAFTSLLLQKSLTDIIKFISSGLLLLAAILLFLWYQGTIDEAFDQVILFAIHNYSNIQRVSFGAFMTIQQIVLVGVFPAMACLLVLALYRRGRTLWREKYWSIGCLFALSGFLSCFPRPDSVHISFCVVLALPLFAGLIGIFLSDTVGPLRTGGSIAAFLLIASPIIVLAADAASKPQTITQAGAITIMNDHGTAELLERLSHVPSSDAVFIYPYDPLLPFLAKRTHPARFDILVPQYSTPSQYLETCLEVTKNAEWVVFNNAISSPSFYRRFFPAMENPSPPEKLAFEQALRDGFTDDAQYGKFQLLRRANAATSLCRDIADPLRPRERSQHQPE